MKQSKRVALVLSSGGARGYVHIGAIEALTERGYEISSIAGTSIGALVGAMYAAGRLAEVKKEFASLSTKEIVSLIDLSVGKNHLVKGERVIEKLKAIVPDVNIEDLKIPFRAVAGDLETQREVVFSKGSLYRALRASISIPTVFRPVKIGTHLLVDGAVANPLPLNRVVRHEDGDLLVSINVCAPASPEIDAIRTRARRLQQSKLLSLNGLAGVFKSSETGSNYLSLMLSTLTLLIQRNTVLAKKVTPPDISLDIPMNRFNVYDFSRLEQISRAGYEAMNEVLDKYEFIDA